MPGPAKEGMPVVPLEKSSVPDNRQIKSVSNFCIIALVLGKRFMKFWLTLFYEMVEL